MKPQLVDVDPTLVLEAVGPLPAVLVLRILPLRSYASLEQVVVGLEGELGDGSNVVLKPVLGKQMGLIER